MRGKKVDAEFVSEFIVNCAKRKITNPVDVAKEAEQQIAIIDQKIKEAESLKKVRSKLVDVIGTLSVKVKDNSEDKKALEFYQLSDLRVAATIARCIQDSSHDISILDKEYVYLVKEMLASKILRREGKELAQGDEYLNFLDFLTQVCY